MRRNPEFLTNFCPLYPMNADRKITIGIEIGDHQYNYIVVLNKSQSNVVGKGSPLVEFKEMPLRHR